MNKLRWSKKDIEEFRAWHENRMKELRYPENICKELRRYCDKFLSQA